jgi:hypothetical protein
MLGASSNADGEKTMLRQISHKLNLPGCLDSRWVLMHQYRTCRITLAEKLAGAFSK